MNSSHPDLCVQAKSFPPFPLAGERGREIGSRAWKAGAEVKRLLSCPPLLGKVVAHFSGNLYLMTDHEDLFWGSTGSFPMHRRCLQVSWLPPSYLIRPGQRFQLRHPALCIGNAFSVDLSSYTEWTPAPVFTRKPRPLAELWPCCWKLNGLFNCLDSPKGLGRAIPLIFAIAGNEEVPSLSSGSIPGRLLTPVLAITKACLQRDLNAVLMEGENLVGLGPGLTPSGDDFLGGLLFLIYSLESAYPEFFSWNQGGVIDFIGRAKSQTHPISHAFLNDFAWGHAPAPLHELVTALIYGCDFEEIFSAVLPCLGFGHSSGWDVLAGFLTGCLMVPRNRLAGLERAGFS
jgi:hypothetical protein